MKITNKNLILAFIICSLSIWSILFFAIHLLDKSIINLKDKKIELLEVIEETELAIIKSLEKIIELKDIQLERAKAKKIYAYVTAFNTVKAQTDNTPCQAKFGYICGRDDVVACPRHIPAFTKIEILNKEYWCQDWTATKYNGRFDISFDKDILGARQFGKKYLEILIYEQN